MKTRQISHWTPVNLPATAAGRRVFLSIADSFPEKIVRREVVATLQRTKCSG